MAKIISQDTFDEVIKENVVEFSMATDEARDETIKQFEAQGINLANIIKDLSINEETGEPYLNESIEILKLHISGENRIADKSIVLNCLQTFVSECVKSIPHRVLASKLDGHQILLVLLEQELSSSEINNDVVLAILKCEAALSNKQPDIFDAEALALIVQILQTEKQNIDIISATLQWIANVCIMHEINRQNIMNADIIKYLKPLYLTKKPQVVSDVCAVFRYLILDDDIRVEFGKAPEHARMIASEVILDLTNLLTEFDDVKVLCDLLLTIAALTVRHEFCVAIKDANGLEHVFDIMNKFPDEIKLNREALKLLRALAGHDQVKVQIIQKGAAPIIHNILLNNKENEPLAAIVLLCISTLTLRVKENGLAFFRSGIADTIVETMKIHPNHKLIQRNAAWAIRNMVARTSEHCDDFLSIGVEGLLNKAMADHPTIKQDIKSALRDLGCKVELKEEWTGKAAIKISE